MKRRLQLFTHTVRHPPQGRESSGCRHTTEREAPHPSRPARRGVRQCTRACVRARPGAHGGAPGAGRGRQGHTGLCVAPTRRHSLLGVVSDLVRDRKVQRLQGEFNYMLLPTSSGYDGTITHVIYQQDTCIHNKPKAKHYISAKAKNIKLRPDVRCAHLGGGGRTEKPRSSPPFSEPGVPMHRDHRAPAPNPRVCRRRPFAKGGGGADFGNSPPRTMSSQRANHGPQGAGEATGLAAPWGSWL